MTKLQTFIGWCCANYPRIMYVYVYCMVILMFIFIAPIDFAIDLSKRLYDAFKETGRCIGEQFNYCRSILEQTGKTVENAAETYRENHLN